MVWCFLLAGTFCTKTFFSILFLLLLPAFGCNGNHLICFFGFIWYVALFAFLITWNIFFVVGLYQLWNILINTFYPSDTSKMLLIKVLYSLHKKSSFNNWCFVLLKHKSLNLSHAANETTWNPTLHHGISCVSCFFMISSNFTLFLFSERFANHFHLGTCSANICCQSKVNPRIHVARKINPEHP